MRKLDRENWSLDFVEAKIAAEEVMMVARFHSLIAENAQFLRQLSVPTNNHSCVTSGAQIFRGIKNEKAHFTHRARFRSSFAKWILGANCLRRIFNDVELVTFRNLMDRVHLAAQTEQVDRNNRANFLAALDFPIAIRSGLAVFLDVFLNRAWRNVVRFRIAIDEKRLRAGARDAASGRKERVRRGDDGIAASDAERHQNGQESICAGGNTDRV